MIGDVRCGKRGAIVTTGAWTKMAALAGGAMLLGGCIQVKAPDKPIEINLNVNVKQEVVVRLQKDASDFINTNPELFPK